MHQQNEQIAIKRIMDSKKKIFKSKFFNTIYEVQDESWIDKDTYVVIFQDMKDAENETYHLEVEYHKDEDKFTYTKVYEHERLNGEFNTIDYYKTQIRQYILKKVGKIPQDNIILSSFIHLKVEVVVPSNMTMSEYNAWFNDKLKVEVKSNDDRLIKIIKVTKEN